MINIYTTITHVSNTRKYKIQINTIKLKYVFEGHLGWRLSESKW